MARINNKNLNAIFCHASSTKNCNMKICVLNTRRPRDFKSPDLPAHECKDAATVFRPLPGPKAIILKVVRKSVYLGVMLHGRIHRVVVAAIAR